MGSEKDSQDQRVDDTERREMNWKMDRLILWMRHNLDMQLMVADDALDANFKASFCLVFSFLNFVMLVCLLLKFAA